jgi:hypothetical protein
MSIVRAPRGKARNIYKPWSSVDRGYARLPERPAKLRTPQDCYVCLQVMAIGTMASWSSQQRRWRHTGCSVGRTGNGFRA